MDWLKGNVFNLIAAAILAAFVTVWTFIMIKVAKFEATTEVPVLELATGIELTGGLLGTTIATITASALGFTVAETKAAKLDNESFSQALSKKLTNATLLAVLVYLGVSLAVFLVWVLNEKTSPEVLSAYAYTAIGWLVGSASVAFKTSDA